MVSLIKKTGDIDIDFADRNKAASVVSHVQASIIKGSKIDKHNTGVYFHLVPTDPITSLASIDYEQAEKIGWYKVDLLNVGVYEQVRSEEHLLEMMEKELDWSLFTYPEFTEKLIHINNYGTLISDLKPTSIEHLAMILALIRPGKKYLIPKCKDYGFDSIKDDIWKLDSSDAYAFKKAHSVSYAILIYVHANLLIEQLDA